MSNNLPRKALIAVSSFKWCHLSRWSQDRRVIRGGAASVRSADGRRIRGGFGIRNRHVRIDDVSLTPPFLSGSEHAILNNPKHPFMVKIKSQLKKASDLKKEDYGFFFASAGHAALYDYPTAKGLQAIAADIWERGGI